MSAGLGPWTQRGVHIGAFVLPFMALPPMLHGGPIVGPGRLMLARNAPNDPPPRELTTVYPARAGAFPAASFTTFVDAFMYARTMADLYASGVCTCPAESFATHYPDTLRVPT